MLFHHLLVTLTYQVCTNAGDGNESYISLGNFGHVENMIFLNWDSVHARLNSQYEAQSYNKNKQKKISSIQEICLERTYF